LNSNLERLDGTRNALHGSDSAASAQKEISFFFGSKYGVNTACYNDTTCCIIKPHAVAEGIGNFMLTTIKVCIL
jgi:nucleoside-diphosphate kinase